MITKRTIKNEQELQNYINANFSSFFNGYVKDNIIYMRNGDKFKLVFERNQQTSKSQQK